MNQTLVTDDDSEFSRKSSLMKPLEVSKPVVQVDQFKEVNKGFIATFMVLVNIPAFLTGYVMTYHN